ncbi:MAG: hypothetical protein J7642_21445 [Cyanobacteria bacterium SBC]|nr:hypothetical protein [Cyanobacteria bacterium SBC]
MLEILQTLVGLFIIAGALALWIAYKRRHWIDRFGIKHQTVILGGGAAIAVALILAGLAENISPTSTSLTPRTTPTPIPTQNLIDPVDRLESEIEKLVKVNREGTRFDFTYTGSLGATGNIIVWFPLKDNFNSNMIRDGAKITVRNILRKIDESNIDYQQVRLAATFVLSDKYGNSSEEKVLMLTYSKATVDRINWDNFLFQNMFDLADEVWFHPAFQNS